jgi:[glutamine synthetase] adenylyltransferase / [glutamine synthetase]-adenylyl-L-tyrosine phosphorylase
LPTSRQDRARERAWDATLFQDGARAAQNLEKIRSRLSRQAEDRLRVLLPDLPDPDSALNYFERLTEAAEAGTLDVLRRSPSATHYALTVFSFSPFLGETLLANQDLISVLSRPESLRHSHGKEEFREDFARLRARSLDADLASLLARFKRREYIAILLRDVLGLAELAETTDEISCLSDVLIEQALLECDSAMRKRCGAPQIRDRAGKVVEPRFSILALGKLGGCELNYSSDTDLMFLYEGSESDDQSESSAREYFVRLAQNVTEILSRVTKEGFVFRIDLRLRPQGREGESAVSLESAVRYYRDLAQDWERQAMIKARHCAGDASLARQFLGEIESEVYSEQINFTAIDTALRARDLISEKRRPAGSRDREIDVKLDRGGIRDIEFLVQCLQRVYGGKEPWLQSRGTLFALQKLHDKQHISGADFQTLTTAYKFLRNLEHRLQLRQGQQTHRVPADPHSRRILARSLRMDPNQLARSLREQMNAAVEIYERIVKQQRQQSVEEAEEGFTLRTLDLSLGRVHADHQILQRLADTSSLHAIASRDDVEPHTRRNLFRFLSSAFTSPERYAAVAAAPQMLERAMEIFATSEYLTDMLVRHPEDISSLGYLRASTPRHQPVLFSEEHPVRSGLSPALLESMARPDVAHGYKLTLMRRRFRHQMFLSGARDLTEVRPVTASLADTTAAAAEAISAGLALAGSPKGLAVLALGRLGSGEFDCLSDADLLFVRHESSSAKEASIAAEALVSALSTYTCDGTVLPVDVRLRPYGSEGEITFTAEVFAKYCEHVAQPWEALSYTKLRFIAGDEKLSSDGISASRLAGARFASSGKFAADVNEMRSKLDASANSDNIRSAPGSMYDIDFLSSFLIVKHGIQTASGNTRERLQQLGKVGHISVADLQVLLEAVDLFRTTDHAVRLVTGRALKELPASETARKSVESLVARVLEVQRSRDLEQLLSETTSRIREIYERIVV